MIRATRLQLTAWYLLILAIIIGLLSVALDRLLVFALNTEAHAVRPSLHHQLARLFAHDEVILAYQIVAIDLGLLLLAAMGAYFLAGRTLRPIQDVMERQRRFAAAASHELRTPLTALQGNMEVALLNRRTPEEYEQVLREAVADTERMGHLIRDLTLLVRPESDASVLHLASVDLRDIAASASGDMKQLAARKTQTLAVELDGPLPVRGDPLKLRQAVVNLLENAVTYTPTSGTIRLTGRREHGHAILEVRDTGPGIAPQHLAHLFEPFYQADSARSNADHVGLGLSLAAWTVRAHGGRLGVDSHLGVGTVFTVSLPLAS